MRRLLMFIAPTIAGWLWRRYKTNAAQRQGVPRAATRPNTSQPQEQVEAMERETDVPGGIRP